MGIGIDRVRFDESDYVQFAERLEHDLAALQLLLSRSGFGLQPRTLGAELELFLVDWGDAAESTGNRNHCRSSLSRYMLPADQRHEPP